MRRISTNLASIDMSYYARLREWKLNELQNKMANQTRINNLRDDPVGAAHATRHQSKIARLDRYMLNISRVRDKLSLSEGNLRSGLDILHRVRELAVQGANGTYSPEQLAYMGQEVDQLLRELMEVANAQDAQGNYVFSGFRSKIEPFRVHTGRVEGSQATDVITSVEYVGDIGRARAEVAEKAAVDYTLPGNHVFWAERQQIYSSIDALPYRVQQDSTIRIDGVEIPLKQGDNVYAIIDKINASGAPVRARLDPVRNSLALEGTSAHQIWPEDVADSTVLQDLGVVRRGVGSPPLNLAESAAIYGGSIFDMLIALRNSLYAANQDTVGGSALRGVDDAIESLSGYLGEIGSLDERLGITNDRLAFEEPQYVSFLAGEHDLDLTQAVTELKMLEFTHQAALATSARILQPTLLDFLR